MAQAFNQLQQIRPYYKLSEIAYDRYEYQGELHQVLVAARQIDPSGLPKVAQTWVNRHLVYTHGFGLGDEFGQPHHAERLPRVHRR